MRPALSILLNSDEATRWAAAVSSYGGTVSNARLQLVRVLIKAYKSCGWWDLMDDAALLVAENATQALTSLKLRRLMTATAAPTFTTDRGYAFNGTSQYIDTGFVPSTMAAKMANLNVRMSVYERTNVGANTTSFGCTGAGGGMNMRARNASSAFFANMGAGSQSLNSGSVTDSRGLIAGACVSGTTQNGHQNGVAMTPNTGLTPVNSALSAFSFYISANNNQGTAATFRAATIGYADWGAPLSTTAQELAIYNALQTFMTAVGANV